MIGPLRHRGFTLVEMLVVMLIAGLFVGLVATVARPDEQTLLRNEAERLAQLFDTAVTESRLTGKTIGWTADADGYRFWRLRDESGWSEIDRADTLRPRMLPAGMHVSAVRVDDLSAAEGVRLQFTAFEPALSFVVELSMGPQRYAIVGSPIGDVRVIGAGSGDAQTSQR